jgi:arabinogalactan oligomer/maltooligosaccharide transport system substrate-binding protein
MKHHIRILEIFTMILVLISLAACGGDSGRSAASDGSASAADSSGKVIPEDGAVLLVWDQDGPRLDYLKLVADAFIDTYPERNISVEFAPVSGMAAGRKLSQDGPAGTGADVLALNHDDLIELYQSGLVMPNLVNAEFIRETASRNAVRASTMDDGQIYGFPFSIQTYALVRNTRLVPQAPQTIAELIEIARGFHDPSRNRFGIYSDFRDIYISYGLIKAMGGDLFGPDEDDPAALRFNSAETAAAMEEILKFREVSIENIDEYNDDIMLGLFAEEQSAFMLNGTWSLSGLEESGVPFAVSTIPSINGAPVAGFSTIQVYAVNSYSPFPKAAQLFAELASSPEMLSQRFAMTGDIPPYSDFLETLASGNDPVISGFALQAVQSTPMPQLVEMSYVWSPSEAAISDIWNGRKSISQALDLAQEVISDQIAVSRRN